MLATPEDGGAATFKVPVGAELQVSPTDGTVQALEAPMEGGAPTLEAPLEQGASDARGGVALKAADVVLLAWPSWPAA